MGRKRSTTDEDTPRTRKGLAEPFIGLKDLIGLWFHHEHELIAFHKFGALYSAKKFVEQVIGDYDTSWKDPRTLALRKGWITITSQEGPSLEDIMEHEYTPAEQEWTLPIPYPGYAESIRKYHWGTHPDVASPRNGPRPSPTRTPTGGIAAAETAPERKTRERRERPSAPRPDGLVSIGDIAASLAIDPREARQILRASSLTKPAHGWAFPANEVDSVKHVLNTGRKKR